MYVCMHACMHICMCVCMHASVSMPTLHRTPKLHRLSSTGTPLQATSAGLLPVRTLVDLVKEPKSGMQVCFALLRTRDRYRRGSGNPRASSRSGKRLREGLALKARRT